ncbi:CDP-diacylglycerol--serine O-phosphatidyltransferase [Peniophora sp. CONT]|nr:CDP-diacylglycerol--serine O-phosphatidyltransferase [Peniophora sp. CONT]
MQRRKPSSTQEMGTSPTPPAAALQKYVDTEGHFSLVRNFRLADLVTIMNGFCGVFSVFYSAHYLLSNDEAHLWRALACPVGGLLFDFFDGKVARWRNSSSLLGQELDSLADLISFGVAPAVLAFVLGLRSVLDMVGLTIFVCCGLARLARFNATVASVPKDETGKSKYFEGLPIPSSLAIVAAMTYCVSKGYIEGKSGVPGPVYSLGPAGELHGITLVFVGWAAMMVSKTLHVPKL